jgi:hypothetical protein
MPGSEYSEAANRSWDYPATELVKAFSDRDWMIGHGIGTTSLGTQYVARIMGVPATNVAVESGYGNFVLELGVLGPILWLAWTLSFTWAAIKIVLGLKGTWAFPLALSIEWFSLILLFGMTWTSLTPYQNFVVNAYFWLLVGILFRLPGLVAEEQAGSGQLSLVG